MRRSLEKQSHLVKLPCRSRSRANHTGWSSSVPRPTPRGRGALPNAYQMTATPTRNAKEDFFAFLSSPMIIYYSFVKKDFAGRCILKKDLGHLAALHSGRNSLRQGRREKKTRYPYRWCSAENTCNIVVFISRRNSKEWSKIGRQVWSHL